MGSLRVKRTGGRKIMFEELVMALREGKCVVFEEGEGGGIKIHGVFDNPEQARAHFDGFDGPALLPAYFLVSREGCSEVWQ